ncbi:hypothetical protein CSV78_12330 [Sporosarcina sp. P16a]|nr:hypothetical protein CSV78_12330 [Sporosarcina sp. P16a]PIC92083.1 hypothetical protein CSV70_12560 [Sporosarcina sp. P25]
MIAYMINDYYICTSYEEVSSLLHDILHHSRLPNTMEIYIFHICKGNLNIEKQEFISDNGLVINLSYKKCEDIYYNIN